MEFVGPDTAKGREMTLLWHHEGFRRSFRVITAVWGAAEASPIPGPGPAAPEVPKATA